MKVREHRGLLTESMATLREVKNRQELLDIVRKQLAPFGVEVEPKQLHVEPYMYDDRIGWETHIITIDGYGVWGMADGPI